ncbi:MAG: hypothetical protein LBK63_05905 [Treponema sp.]|jgi:hypothetical protein|nr:hypothetical protein [Treponema sp.]
MGMTKKAGLFFMLWGTMLCAVPVFAQTAERLDAILDTERVSFAQAAVIVLPAAGLLAPDAGEAAAFAQARFYFPRRAEHDGPITMGELSRLVMQCFNLTGGFLYALFPGKRYAYRALAWRRLLPSNPDPGRFLTGEELLYIMGRVLSLAGEGQAAPETENRLEKGQGRGLSSGSEGILSYKGEFELE